VGRDRRWLSGGNTARSPSRRASAFDQRDPEVWGEIMRAKVGRQADVAGFMPVGECAAGACCPLAPKTGVYLVADQDGRLFLWDGRQARPPGETLNLPDVAAVNYAFAEQGRSFLDCVTAYLGGGREWFISRVDSLNRAARCVVIFDDGPSEISGKPALRNHARTCSYAWTSASPILASGTM
jgi:hypothetical protein